MELLSLFVILFIILVFVLTIGGTIFWIWMIIDCAANETDKNNEKLIWILIILFTHFIGALIYYFVRRPQRIKETSK